MLQKVFGLIIAVSLGSVMFSVQPSLANPHRPRVQVVGCYSDLRLIESEGMVVGNGTFAISRVGRKYEATFVELMHDGGEYYPVQQVENLTVDEAKGVISFDLTLHDGNELVAITGARGSIGPRGIKMDWHGKGGEHGGADPFLKRRPRC